MDLTTQQALKRIHADARGNLAELAKDMIYAPSEDKEDILAGIEFERWMVEACEECLKE